MKSNRTSSLSVGIKSASSEGGSEELGSEHTGGRGQGGEKGRPVNISFLSCYFFLQETSFLSSWVWSLWWVPVAVSACTVAAICKKSLTKHMTGVAAGPPLLLPSPWGPWGEPILPFGTGWVRGPTHRQSSQQSRFALL